MTDIRDLGGLTGRHHESVGAFLWIYGIGVALSLGLCVIGGMKAELLVVAVGVLGLVVVASTAPLLFLYSRAGGGGASSGGMDEGATAVQFQKLADAVEKLGEHQALSDDARRVLNRSKERDLLRKAIIEDIKVGDWDAASVLVQELAERFGYRTDAEEFRDQIETARYESTERKVREAIGGLESLIGGARWTDAMAEASRITRLYPHAHGVDGLRHRVEEAREGYKQDLERRFLHAAGDSRVEEAMELLKEMDEYLTEDEGERFKEVARGVIGQARDNLGVRFKLAVQDKQWDVASEVGERIITEFPNTKMAQEIRGLIDGIRERATTIR